MSYDMSIVPLKPLSAAIRAALKLEPLRSMVAYRTREGSRFWSYL